MGNKLALLALVLAGMALLLQVLGQGGGRSASATPAVPGLAALQERIEALESENEHLRDIVEGLRLTPAAPPERESASVTDPRFDELSRRLAELERRPPSQPAGDSGEELTESERAEFLRHSTVAEELQRAIDRAGDPSATEADRLLALRDLRSQRDPDGIDLRLYVLDSMLELARTSQDGETRADVWRQLSHLTDARLRQPLLDTLAYDQHADAREEAAETLADFLPDVAIEAALRFAAENDVAAGVRRQAASSLEPGR